MLDKLIEHLAKKRKRWKRKRDGDKVEVEMKGATVAEEAPTSLKCIIEEVPRLLAPKLEVGIPTKETDSYRHRGGGDGLGGCTAHTSHYHRGG